MSQDNAYDLIVIGAGSGGLTAAIGGAGIGARTLLIEKAKIGGDCTHYGCIPSKTLIKASKNYRQIKEILGDNAPAIDLSPVLTEVAQKVKTIADTEKAEVLEREYGIDTVCGEASFVDEETLRVGSQKFSSQRFVIATGSRARVPDIQGLKDIPYLTNHQIFEPDNFKSLIIIGGGPIGCELGQAFAALGIQVRLIDSGKTILGREDKQAAELIKKQMEVDGVEFFLDARPVRVERLHDGEIVVFLENGEEVIGERILLAAGRIPNTEGLALENARVQYTSAGISVNKQARSSNKRIYAIGDVVGGAQFTHYANHMGKIALSNSLFGPFFPYEQSIIPRATFTYPEVSSVGETEQSLRQQNKEFLTLYKDYRHIDRAITDNKTAGFIKILTDSKGKILGATILGENAGELIGEIALAMKNDLSITKIADSIHPYPTYSYGLMHTAVGFRGANYTEGKKNLLKKLFRLKGN